MNGFRNPFELLNGFVNVGACGRKGELGLLGPGIEGEFDRFGSEGEFGLFGIEGEDGRFPKGLGDGRLGL